MSGPSCTGNRSKIFPCRTRREYVPLFQRRANSSDQPRRGKRAAAAIWGVGAEVGAGGAAAGIQLPYKWQRRRQTPNSKPQTPKKSQIPSSENPTHEI